MKYNQIYLYPGDNYNGYEQNTVNYFSNTIQNNWVVFDCGAKTGYFTLLFSELCFNGLVHAFEPTTTFQMLSNNINYYGIQNVKLNNLALGEKTGEIEDSIYRIWGQNAEKMVYNFTTIDDYCISNNINNIDLIKIDVDSYDFEVLKGSINVLSKIKPIIVVELNQALNIRNSSKDEVIEWMLSKDYQLNGYTDENYIFYPNKN